MNQKTEFKQNVYDELAQLAKEADILVTLELLTALHDFREDIETRNRLTQTLAFVQMLVPYRKSTGVYDLNFGLLGDTDRSSLVNKIFEIAQALPLTFSKQPNYLHLASLSDELLLEFLEILVDGPRFCNTFGKHNSLIVRRYLKICSDLLEICNLNLEATPVGPDGIRSTSSLWRSFLLFPVQLGDIPRNYRLIQKDTQRVGLPVLPYFALEGGIWLLSREILIETLLVAFSRLLDKVCDNASCLAV